MIAKKSNLKLEFSSVAIEELNNGRRLSKSQQIVNLAKKYNGPSKISIRRGNRQQKLLVCLTEKFKRNETGFANIVQIPNKCVVDLGRPELILQNYMYSRQVSASDLAKHISINEREVYRLVDARRNILKDDHIVAGKLGDALGTPTKLWLDIQYYLRLKTYLELKPYMTKYFDLNTMRDKISMTDMNAVANISSPPPGQILNELYLKPSRIVLEYWSHYFCRDRHSFSKILKGKKMNFDFIARIVKAFDVRASYWIDLQNEYLAGKYARMKLENNHSKSISFISSDRFQIASHMHPGKILLNVFMIPRNLRSSHVAEHMGISRKKLGAFTGGHLSVGPKLAIKLGYTFNTTPTYWLDLQKDFDLNMNRQH
ncbi:MAG TPA: HigA family addiction module antitoxin [Cyclobacteriaceae bacterium]|jgi:addiction module HigA family antidote|nr:HigA family addiction module antitoxin [Cyclobacteriaceae bacterium]